MRIRDNGQCGRTKEREGKRDHYWSKRPERIKKKNFIDCFNDNKQYKTIKEENGK